MPESTARYFQLREDHEPGEPISEFKFTVAVPGFDDNKQPVTQHMTHRLKPIDGHPRIVKCETPIQAEACESNDCFEECDPPTSEQPRKPKAAKTEEA